MFDYSQCKKKTLDVFDLPRLILVATGDTDGLEGFAAEGDPT